ncbi:MAG: hypothetical protein ACR2P8_08345 [Myxococcota bacterium]
MRFVLPVLAFLVLGLGAASAQAQSCSTFVVVKSYDGDAKTAELSYEKGTHRKYFPKPEGANTDTTKIPKKCSKKVTRNTTVNVKPSGGRMSVTQFRENFSGKMRNDLDDSSWVQSNLEKLIADKTKVVAVLRPAKARKDPPTLTTIYLPISEEEIAEIARIDRQAEDVE